MGPLRVAVNFSNYEYNWSVKTKALPCLLILLTTPVPQRFWKSLTLVMSQRAVTPLSAPRCSALSSETTSRSFVSVPSFWQEAINRRLNILCQVSILKFCYDTKIHWLPINGHFNIVHFTIILTSSKLNFIYRQFTLHQTCYILSLKQAETPGVLLPMNCPPVPKTNSVRKAFEWHWGQSAAALLKHTALHCSPCFSFHCEAQNKSYMRLIALRPAGEGWCGGGGDGIRLCLLE